MGNKICAYGEIMMRLSPLNYIQTEDATNFEACYGGTESNVLVALSHLGNQTSFISKIPNNSLGEGVLRHLLRHNVGVSHLIMDGTTLGIYFMEQGFGSKASKVIYHRKNSEINTLKEDDFDYDEVFKDASWFHITGISLAISKNSKDVSLRLVKEAKKRNIKVSFDFNYRSTLWSIDEAKEAYKEIIKYVDVCFGNVFDINNFLDFKEDDDNKTIEKLLKTYNISYLINTKRTIIDSNNHSLKANLFYLHEGTLISISTDEERFEVLDRIGGGDAFVAGVIHILNDNFTDLSQTLQLGLKCGILKHLVKGDVLSLSKNEIYNWMKNQSKDVVR